VSGLTLPALRRYAVARSLGTPGTLPAALDRFGFVQADPIRAPARAQDLTLRHRVASYRAGDLDRAYTSLDVDEDFFVNYGFLPRRVQALMHPRARIRSWPAPGRKVGEAVLAFVRERGEVHPRQVDAHFAHGVVTNYWGGSSSATTHVLDHLHYRGLLRVARRDNGIRVYVPRETGDGASSAAERRARLDALVDVALALYAPVPAATLAWLVNRMRYAVPQYTAERAAARTRALRRAARARIDGIDWYWPADEDPAAVDGLDDRVRLLAPFDPVVWDRRRFEAFWDWEYRFEAYTPVGKRKFGYYALPLLWRDRVVGWANVSHAGGVLDVRAGYVSGRAPRDRGFRAALDEELEAMRAFLPEPDAPPARHRATSDRRPPSERTDEAPE
jgi:uncharacterized protein YcaQ